MCINETFEKCSFFSLGCCIKSDDYTSIPNNPSWLETLLQQIFGISSIE